VTARSFVNATGPFSDRVRQLADIYAKERIRLSRGVHILLPLPEDFGEDALLIPETDDGRVIFAIPWLGRLLVGTTETESTLDDGLIVTRQEADFLLRHLNRYLAQPFEMTDIVSAIAGLRPLVASGNSRDTKRLIRDYEIEIDSHSGLISVLGGKWTVYRAMAADAIDAVQKSLTGRITDSRTREHMVFGAVDGNENVEDLITKYGIRRSTMHHLTEKFGSCRTRILDLVQEDPALRLPILDGLPYIRAEVVYCAREEMAVSVDDVLSRRIGLQFYDWRSAIYAAPVVAHILARELGWSPSHTRREIEKYIGRINRCLEALGGQPVRIDEVTRGVNDEVHRRA